MTAVLVAILALLALVAFAVLWMTRLLVEMTQLLGFLVYGSDQPMTQPQGGTVKPSNHPTGLTALATSALVIVASKAGVDLTAEEAAIFVGLAAALVSFFTPREEPKP